MDDPDQGRAPLKSLQEETRCGILSNAKGEIMILHEGKLTSALQWIEFDESLDDLCLVHEDGHIQKLGLTLDKNMRSNLARGTEVQLVEVLENNIQNSYKLSLIIKDY
jgi:hypothetical protein